MTSVEKSSVVAGSPFRLAAVAPLAGLVGAAAGDHCVTSPNRAGAAVRPGRARCHGRIAHGSHHAGRVGDRLHGRGALRPTHRGSGRGQELRADLRSAALPPLMSLDMIRSVMEDNHRGANVPSRSERRRLAQEQLQQSGGRRLRGGGRRVPGLVPVRDSKVAHGPALYVEATSWAAFIGELKAGRHRP